MNKSQTEQKHFVAAAVVAAELYNAVKVARDISLTASNAKALALRAGNRAMGFRALTDFIDSLAKTTIKTSKEVNSLAIEISRLASESTRLELTLEYLKVALQKAEGAKFAHTIEPVFLKTKDLMETQNYVFKDKVKRLKSELSNLDRDLRSGLVLSAMSKVEATQVESDYEIPLQHIAEKVATSTESIRNHVSRSQNYFSNL